MTDAKDLPGALAERIAAAAPHGTVTLAYSGGLDSRFLAFCAKRLGFRVRLLHVRGPHIAPSETEEAAEGARELGLEPEVIALSPLSLPELANAGRLRCYVCKRGLFTELKRLAGAEPLCDGTNFTDLSAYRPGRRALEELGILSPLAEARIGKPDIRHIGRELGFPHPDQAARPCLLTRFPYGMLPDEKRLGLLARAEDFVAADAFGRTLRCRLRFPDGITPSLHIEKGSLAGASEADVRALCNRLRAAFGEPMKDLRFEIMETLSGYYDRPESSR